MKRFLIHVSTYWCGMDDTFRAVAESEMELWDLAEQLAYDNFQSYSCKNDIAEEEGYDPDEMEESDWDGVEYTRVPTIVFPQKNVKMTKNGMNIAEKSMEKTRFYNREDLKAKDVARLISIWEGEAGESFTDYCNFSREADKNFLLFLAEKYPILYDYHCKVAGNDWLDHCIQYVVDHCGEYLTQWVPAEEYHLSWQLEEMAIYPLADFILKDDGAWEDFVDFFTSEKETASGTPYIDCYDIRELFENGDV